MNPLSVDYFGYRFEHPATEEPDWKGQVERWYQLDAFAYGLAQAYRAMKTSVEHSETEKPALILLASPQASNETDLQFTRTGAQSPAKFVHTLANVRCSPLCQVMDWAGPVLCLQKDPYTQSHGLREAAALLEFGAQGPIWMLSVVREANSYLAQFFILQNERSGQPQASKSRFKIRRNMHDSPLQNDSVLQEWLDSKLEKLLLPGGYELSRVS